MPASDLVAFSHLRWDWVYQRPQHLMSRAARTRRVFFVEEPCFGDFRTEMTVTPAAPNVSVVRPHLPAHLTADQVIEVQRRLLDEFLERMNVRVDVRWYFTPAALEFSSHVSAKSVVYDCMDELSAFAGATATMVEMERALLGAADIVFTGGQSLYEAKHLLHHDVHAMASCVDLEHFRAARTISDEFSPQAGIPYPRIGYCGVLDERLDLPLIATVARAHPTWQFVFAGPVAKIDPSSLPSGDNLHYLGALTYAELPHLMSGWDVGWMPFALNAATRYISPTKTPEYLAAGLPVVSSAVEDVVRAWGEPGFVRIARSPDDFGECIALSLQEEPSMMARTKLDRVLATQSWDALWSRMDGLMPYSRTNAA